MKRFHLIQTGIVSKYNEIKDPDIKLGYGESRFVRLNYMGSAEYEFGASRISFTSIMDEYDNYKLFKSYIVNTVDTPLYIFCHKDMYNEIVEAIAAYSRQGRYGDRSLKEPCNLWAHFETSKPDETGFDDVKWRRMHNTFWWDFENHWMAFFGATDREIAFKRAIENDRAEYLKDIAKPTYR